MKAENMTSTSEFKATDDETAAKEYEDDFFWAHFHNFASFWLV
jgi:hypothetical protein